MASEGKLVPQTVCPHPIPLHLPPRLQYVDTQHIFITRRVRFLNRQCFMRNLPFLPLWPPGTPVGYRVPLLLFERTLIARWQHLVGRAATTCRRGRCRGREIDMLGPYEVPSPRQVSVPYALRVVWLPQKTRQFL